jgi:serine/threonine protein kinase
MSYLLMLKLAQNIAEAMVFLHANNVLYRDLKPGNVLIVSSSVNAKVNAKLTDFGTARNVENAAELFRHTGCIGTVIYTAPEILAAEGYNTQADVYSFAITLWEMFTRRLAWSDAVCWDVPRLVIEGKRPVVPENCPKEFSEIITACWASNLRDRPSFHWLVGEIADLIKREKALGNRIKVPPPPKTAEELRELRTKAEMEEEPVNIRRGGRARTLKDMKSVIEEADISVASSAAAASIAAAAKGEPVTPRDTPPGYLNHRAAKAR